MEEEHAVPVRCAALGGPPAGPASPARSGARGLTPAPLADLVITHALEWPSLTVQWLPVRRPAPGPESAARPRAGAAARERGAPRRRTRWRTGRGS